MSQVPTLKMESHIEQTLLAGVKWNINCSCSKFYSTIRLASVNSDIIRVLAILKNKIVLHWFSADFLCHQPPRYQNFAAKMLEKKILTSEIHWLLVLFFFDHFFSKIWFSKMIKILYVDKFYLLTEQSQFCM